MKTSQDCSNGSKQHYFKTRERERERPFQITDHEILWYRSNIPSSVSTADCLFELNHQNLFITTGQFSRVGQKKLHSPLLDCPWIESAVERKKS